MIHTPNWKIFLLKNSICALYKNEATVSVAVIAENVTKIELLRQTKLKKSSFSSSVQYNETMTTTFLSH